MRQRRTTGHGIERRGSLGCFDDPRHDPLPEKGGPAKEHLSLVREVTEERALRDPGPLCDFGGRRLVESSLGVESEGGLLEPSATVRLPSTHGHDLRC